MRWFACTVCCKGYLVTGKREELLRLLADQKSGYPCITPLCKGRLRAVPPAESGFSYEEVPLLVFYRAVNGFGFSRGAPASVSRTTQLLTTKRVVEVVGAPIGKPERTIIKELVLEDGTRLHFDVSSEGACLYYIEEARDEISPERDTESGGADREEAGRDAEDGDEVSVTRSGEPTADTPVA